MFAAIRQCLVANEQIGRGASGGRTLSSTPSRPSQPKRGALLEDDAGL
jgi:hypothetical protein